MYCRKKISNATDGQAQSTFTVKYSP